MGCPCGCNRLRPKDNDNAYSSENNSVTAEHKDGSFARYNIPINIQAGGKAHELIPKTAYTALENPEIIALEMSKRERKKKLQL